MICSRLFSPNLLAIGCLFCAIGCHPQTVLVPRPEGISPTAADFVAAQQQRLLAVSSLALRGHAELRWNDTTGGHFDDGDFDLILRPPTELSLRVSKLGEKFLWVGGGGGQSWIVLPRENPSRAILRDWPSAPSVGGVRKGLSVIGIGGLGGLGELMEPARLIEALGLASTSASEISSVTWSEARGAWAFTLPNRRLYARGESLLPVGCDWMDATSQVIATCTLDGFEWMRGDRPGGSPASSVQALVSTRLQFSVWAAGRHKQDGSADGELSLSAEVPTFGGDKIKTQLFNWEDVKAALRPEVIEGPEP